MLAGRPRSVSDEAIFEAVAEVVTAVGPARLTLAAVAGRVGVSAPALTQRFGSKRGLLLAFARSETGGPASVFQAARAAAPDPLAAVRAALAALPGPIKTREGLANNLAFLQLDLTDPQLRRQAVAQSRALRAEITALLEDAVARGELSVDEPGTLADTLYAVYCGSMLTWAIDGSGELGDWMDERVERALAPYRPDAGQGA